MCHSKTVACVQIAKENGGSVTNPHHTGYTTAKRRLGGKVPTWIQMRTMAREDKRWIYEYEIPAKGFGPAGIWRLRWNSSVETAEV